MDNHERQLLERGVIALENLAADPVIHIESGPPVCPHCDQMNPDVHVTESEASGPLSEFVVRALCMSCSQVFYALPRMWTSVKSVAEAQREIEELRTVQNGN